MLAPSIHRQEIPACAWLDHWGGVWGSHDQHWRQADQVANLGHSERSTSQQLLAVKDLILQAIVDILSSAWILHPLLDVLFRWTMICSSIQRQLPRPAYHEHAWEALQQVKWLSGHLICKTPVAKIELRGDVIRMFSPVNQRNSFFAAPIDHRQSTWLSSSQQRIWHWRTYGLETAEQCIWHQILFIEL